MIIIVLVVDHIVDQDLSVSFSDTAVSAYTIVATTGWVGPSAVGRPAVVVPTAVPWTLTGPPPATAVTVPFAVVGGECCSVH